MRITNTNAPFSREFGDWEGVGPLPSRPLSQLCQEESFRTLQIQLKMGVNPNAQDQEGLTPLQHMAIHAEKRSLLMHTPFYACLEWLLHYGADAHVVDQDGNSLLHLAWKSGNQEFARYLIDNKVLFPSIRNHAGKRFNEC